MEYTDGYMSNEHQEQLRSVSESSDPSSVSPLAVCTSPKSPSWSPKDHQAKQGRHLKNERNSHVQRDGRPKKGYNKKRLLFIYIMLHELSWSMHELNQFAIAIFGYNLIHWCVCILYVGGCGGKGTWGGLLDTDNGCATEPSDPNYSSNEVFSAAILQFQTHHFLETVREYMLGKP